MTTLHHNVKMSRAISPQRATDNTELVSQIIDRQGYEDLEFVIAAGTLADADATFTVLVEDGDAANLSDAVAVADSELLGTEAAASFQFDDDDSVQKIGYRGNKRYVRLTITPANNTGNADISAVALQAMPGNAPVA